MQKEAVKNTKNQVLAFLQMLKHSLKQRSLAWDSTTTILSAYMFMTSCQYGMYDRYRCENICGNIGCV